MPMSRLSTQTSRIRNRATAPTDWGRRPTTGGFLDGGRSDGAFCLVRVLVCWLGAVDRRYGDVVQLFLGPLGLHGGVARHNLALLHAALLLDGHVGSHDRAGSDYGLGSRPAPISDGCTGGYHGHSSESVSLADLGVFVNFCPGTDQTKTCAITLFYGLVVNFAVSGPVRFCPGCPARWAGGREPAARLLLFGGACVPLVTSSRSSSRSSGTRSTFRCAA